MYNNPFYMMGPANTTMNMIGPNLMRNGATRVLTTANSATNGGIFSKLGTSIAGLKKINWSGLINNTSKTLGIINQSIPIVKQVGPMVGNMRQMMKVASIFKDETEPRRKRNNYNTTTNRNYSNNNIYNNTNNSPNSNIQKSTTIPPKQENTTTNYNQEYNESPTFFINT